MNYYERIQKSVDFIEAHLADDFCVEQAAEEAFMSLANFYRMFLSIVGFTVKEYVRRRRLSLSVMDLRNWTVLDVAIKYGYSSADSFARAFKKEFGRNPSLFKSAGNLCPAYFGRINIMDQYFELSDKELVEKYPDIKLLKKLPSMKTACFKYFGPEPENHAFAVMKKWVDENGIKLNETNADGDANYRIFGFNNPDPSNVNDSNEIYGYEVCITVSDQLYNTLEDALVYGEKKSYAKVMRKTLTGGKFAVVSVKASNNIGLAIMNAWQRFNKWMSLSKFVWGGQQYLEEHLEFSDNNEHTGGVELFMPVK